MGRSILIVDDDELMRSFFCSVLADEGHRIEEARNGKEALAKLAGGGFDLVVTDLRMPDMSGIDLMREAGKTNRDCRWIVVTAHGSIENAVDAMKTGAADYLTKPLGSPEDLRHVVRRVLREAEKEERISLLSEEVGKRFPPVETIFLGEKMKEVSRLVREVSPTPATVLITGASGTGKEVIARLIHGLSPRRDGPFVAVQCSALPEALLESELFGHERGAFTGATASRKGRFELADGGTIFLDEIGEIPPSVQVKLLRVLQEREFERVGGTRSLSVDVRILSATNRDLKAEVASGKFREDFFYRLNVFPIALPPLSERREAILPLAEFFSRKFAESFGKPVPGISDEGRNALLLYRWPGNVRELQNVIERAVILAGGNIDISHLNLEIEADPPSPGEGLLRLQERESIMRILDEEGGNRRRAAERLGISVRTLQYRIKEFGL